MLQSSKKPQQIEQVELDSQLRASSSSFSSGLGMVSYLRHFCGSLLDLRMSPLWPCSENASLPGSSLSASLQLRRTDLGREAEDGETSRRQDQWSCWYSNWARAGGLELPQECGKAVPPPHALFAQQLLRVGAGDPLSDLLLCPLPEALVRILTDTTVFDPITDRRKPVTSRSWTGL